MLKLHPIEFFLRTLPEGFLVILAIYIFSNSKINKKKYFITSIIFSLSVFVIRMLPINYGVHMILSVLFLLFISVIYNKFDVIISIKSIIIIYLIQLFSEAINVAILNLMDLNLEELFKNPVNKTILGLPSLMITTIVIMSFYIFNKKEKGKSKWKKYVEV